MTYSFSNSFVRLEIKRLFVAIVFLTWSFCPFNLQAVDFHVSPKGDDNNPGTSARPFKTIERARDAIRVLKASHGLPESGVTILLHSGNYVLDAPLELTPMDSGAPHRPIRYCAAPGETPVITSAKQITGWEKYTETNEAVASSAIGHLWFAEIPKGWRFHALYVNDQPQPIACGPNSEQRQWRSWPRAQSNGKLTPDGMEITVPDHLLNHLPANGDVEVNFFPVQYWNSLPVLKKIDGDTAVLASRNPCTWNFKGRFFEYGALQFRNALAFLNKPGEWCVDSTAGRVYFWPRDEIIGEKKITAPTLCELMRFQGDDLAARSNFWRVKFDAQGLRENDAPPLTASSAAAFDQVVHDVEIVGVTFEGTDRLPEDQWPTDWLKRNSENPDGTIFFQGASACVISNCIFRNCGAYAVALDHFAQRISVLDNEMADLGCGGVEISGYGPGTLDVNHHNTVRRNYIHNTGQSYLHSAAVTIFGSGHNDISLNWIADVPYAAVQICGANQTVLNTPDDPLNGPAFDFYGNRSGQYQMRSQELPPPSGHNDKADFEEIKPFLHSGGNWIVRNIVDEYMTTLGDGGAFYCWSVDHDNVWMENLVKRQKYRTDASVLYMDDWTGRTILEGNMGWAAGPPNNAVWWDNSHNPTPAARPIKLRSPGTTNILSASNKTIVWWRYNTNSFPAKPAGFDERFRAIQNDANYEGGWPKSVMPLFTTFTNATCLLKRKPFIADEYPDKPVLGLYFDKKPSALKSLPTFAETKSLLPSPIFDENKDLIKLYWKAWELGFTHFVNPQPDSGFVSPFADAAFVIEDKQERRIFQWDTCFMTMFYNVASPLTPGIGSLDNFYAHQFPDGEISCQILQIGEQVPRGSNIGKNILGSFGNGAATPTSPWRAVTYRGRPAPDTVPYVSLDWLNHPLFSWAEMEHYQITGDRARIALVYEPLVRYYDALKTYLRQGNGLYMTDWCSMDNSPRNQWLEAPDGGIGGCGIDISSEMVMFAKDLATMSRLLNKANAAVQLEHEAEETAKRINQLMWDPKRKFYFDLTWDNKRAPVKTIAGFWPLIARIPSKEQTEALVAELENSRTFNRLAGVPTLAANEPEYNPNGGYWRGAVWAPTETMVIRGLERSGADRLARKIALKYLNTVLEVFEKTGTIWENYAPDAIAPGEPAQKDFVGWSGIAPILYFLEDSIGLKPDAPANTLTWNLTTTKRVGCKHYRFNGHVVDLLAMPKGKGKWRLSILSNGAFTLNVRSGKNWNRKMINKGKTTFIFPSSGTK